MLKKFLSIIGKLLGGSLRFIKFVVGAVILFSFAGLATIVVTYFYFAGDLPDIDNLEDYHPPVISEVFANDGSKIGEFWIECRKFVPFEKIPKEVINAFVDSEDSRFFEHRGIDVKSIIRAFIANIRAGTITQGGSTITQQITRSLLLTRERTWHRKIKEAILATRLERELSKEQILTLYLNQIYLGNRSYGVAAAARNYFHKDLDKLSLGQIALIAGLPTAPTTFSPINNPVEARMRQRHVVRRMVEEGHISSEQSKVALEESFDIFVAGTDKSFNDPKAAYFNEYVRRKVKDIYGDEFLYHKGLKIYTTLDARMQNAAYDAVRSGVESMDRRQGYRGPISHVSADQIQDKAVELAKNIMKRQGGEIIAWPPKPGQEEKISINFITGDNYEAIVTGFNGNDTNIKIGNTSGVIKLKDLKWAKGFSTKWLGNEGVSYVSSPHKILKIGDVILARRLEDGSFALAQKPLVQSALFSVEPQTGFIKAMMGGYDFRASEFNRATQALRQPGSSFKPFVYAAALDKGYTYDTMVLDAPVIYQVGGREKVWSPRNYGGEFKGPTPFKNALQFSRNVPTVKIAYDIGIHYVTAFARKLGLTSHIDKYLSMSLGANEVHLNEMVLAYAALANHGNLMPPRAIIKIVDAGGEVLEQYAIPENEDKKTPPVKKRPKGDQTEVKENDLNPTLFREGMAAVENDNLILTDLELKTLYGQQIPDGNVMTPQTAYLMTTLLKGVVEGGTGTRVKALGKPVAGKTGTTNDETDAWFIGFVPKLAAGVWIGFDEVKPIGKGITGGNTAAPIFLSYMKAATKDLGEEDFTKPDGFPHADIASLPGGSALFGARPNQDLTMGGADRAGQFFEDDLEEIEGEIPEEDSEEQPY